MDRYVLLTGATGLVGRYLLRDFLTRNIPVAMIVRPSRDESARVRMERVLDHWEKQRGSYLPRPVCLEGNLVKEGLGLDRDSRRWIARHCDRVLHNAASLTFDGADRRGEPWLSNLTGTRNVLELSREAGIGELHYMSTAYVCGRREGPVYESELDCGQAFRNDYEQSKLQAEQAVRSASFLNSLTVYRPAIIIGDSQTGYTSSYHALYLFLQLIYMLDRFLEVPRDAEGYRHVQFRLNLTGDERRNLVPVDWISQVTTALFENRKCHGRTYHLTPPEPVSVRQVEEACAKYFKFRGVSFQGPGRPLEEEQNDLEKLFYEQFNTYEAYWNHEPVFDCTNTMTMAPHLPCPVLDEPMIHRLIDFAIEDRWGKRRMRPHQVAFDAAPRFEALGALSASKSSEEKSLLVGVDLWGPGGGQWGASVRGDVLNDIGQGIDAEFDVVLRTDTGTFAALLRRETSVQHVIEHGLVEVLARSNRSFDPTKLLSLFTETTKQLSPRPPHNHPTSRQTA